MIISRRGAIGLLFICLASIGCEEYPYRVSIDGKVPPTFTIKTHESVFFVRILKSPAPDSEIYPNEAGIWQIEYKDRGGWPSTITEIKYGIAPKDFIQKVPKDGAAPPTLKEGEEYMFFAPTPANIKGIRFKIENGRSVILD